MELLSESTVGLLSDYCRTTVGLSEYCRILSDKLSLRSARDARDSTREHATKSATNAETIATSCHEVANLSFAFLWLRDARRPGTHDLTTLPAPADNADGTRAGGIPSQRTASAPMPTAATGTTLRSLTPSWAACAVWSATRRMPSWACK